jgi:hypothetical protein
VNSGQVDREGQVSAQLVLGVAHLAPMEAPQESMGVGMVAEGLGGVRGPGVLRGMAGEGGVAGAGRITGSTAVLLPGRAVPGFVSSSTVHVGAPRVISVTSST